MDENFSDFYVMSNSRDPHSAVIDNLYSLEISTYYEG